MKILVTGSKGFIGKNLCISLIQRGFDVLTYDLENTEDEFVEAIHQANFVIHLAGINRPLTPEEFYDGNVNLTLRLVELLKEESRNIPLLFSSSIQAEQLNDYGKSKRQAEDIVTEYNLSTGSDVFVFRLANAFGKWCRPNYNSVVATFCYNIANSLPIQVNVPNAIIPFVYIDDIVDSFINCIGKKGSLEIQTVEPIYKISLGDLAGTLNKFKHSRESFMIGNMLGFEKKLYSTYLSYLPKDQFGYELKMNIDNRGSFTEFIKSEDKGQISINVSKPGIIKGNHWHHTKNEKFLVVSGTGIIRFRKIGETKVIEYNVSGEKLTVIDIPTGYTHNIENIGNDNLVTVIWCNEIYDKNKPDTFFEEV